jgi:hypothetical protein
MKNIFNISLFLVIGFFIFSCTAKVVNLTSEKPHLKYKALYVFTDVGDEKMEKLLIGRLKNNLAMKHVKISFGRLQKKHLIIDSLAAVNDTIDIPAILFVSRFNRQNQMGAGSGLNPLPYNIHKSTFHFSIYDARKTKYILEADLKVSNNGFTGENSYVILAVDIMVKHLKLEKII